MVSPWCASLTPWLFCRSRCACSSLTNAAYGSLAQLLLTVSAMRYDVMSTVLADVFGCLVSTEVAHIHPHYCHSHLEMLVARMMCCLVCFRPTLL